MASIKIAVSIGGYKTRATAGNPDQIEIEVPIPDRVVDAYGYKALVETTFDKTGELVETVKAEEGIVDAEIVEDEEQAA